MRCSHFGPRSNDTGGTHCRGAASEIGQTAQRCGGYRYVGYPNLASFTPGRSTASTPIPEVGAECVSSARSDLCGGRPDSKGEGCPYRDPINGTITSRPAPLTTSRQSRSCTLAALNFPTPWASGGGPERLDLAEPPLQRDEGRAPQAIDPQPRVVISAGQLDQP